MKIFKTRKLLFKLVLIVNAIVYFGTANAQNEFKITGVIIDENKEPVIYASVAMWNCSDSSIVAGTISGETGNFEITHTIPGNYLISTSCIGYLPARKKADVQNYQSIDLGEILLHSNTVELNEAIVHGERIKAKQQLDNTIYFVNNKIQKASNTGIDIIKFIPGIQVDMLHKVSLDGSQNIIIQVNGIERDESFLNQLNADNIDRVEVNNNPGIQYRSDITGLINIILKERNSNGMSGHLYAEVPTRFNEVYSFPGASINYSFKDITLYASYDGEYSYFDMETTNHKKAFVQNNSFEFLNKQELQQKNWSHKFHLGMDYFLNKSNQLNFYGFINPYSNKHDGNVTFTELADNAALNSFSYNKNDRDKNLSYYASAYFKHLFSNPKKELTFDMNYYHLQASNSIRFSENNRIVSQISNSEPYQNSWNARVNYCTALGENLKLETGTKQSLTILADNDYLSFSYKQMVSAAYALSTYTKQKFQINGGARIEYAIYNVNKDLDKTFISVLPGINVKYDLSKKDNLKFAYQKQIVRPNIYQLNPNRSTIDPYTTQKGNPYLKPIIRHTLALDYSASIHNNFLSVGAFYEHSANVIENLTLMSDSLLFEKETNNLGNSQCIGIKMLGSFKLHKNLTFNPLFRLYHLQTQANELSSSSRTKNRKQFVLESGFSAILLLKHDIALSALIKCNSLVNSIQSNYAEDALYFISLDKTLSEKLTFGITTAIPFKKKFTNNSYETIGNNFTETDESNIVMSAIPIWFKLKYTFASGKKVNRINRTDDFKENKLKKGF
jgi:hypothetical protein